MQWTSHLGPAVMLIAMGVAFAVGVLGLLLVRLFFRADDPIRLRVEAVASKVKKDPKPFFRAVQWYCFLLVLVAILTVGFVYS